MTVLLHGYCGSSAYWEELLPLLGAAGRIIIPDQRGHGRSGAPEEAVYGMDAFAGDIAALLDALGEQQAILLGHSLGGYVTLAFAEAYPERLRGFGLIHSTPLPDSEEAQANRDKAVQTIAEQGIEPFVDGIVPKLFAAPDAASMQSKVERAAAIGYGTSPAGAQAAALGMKERPDRSAVLCQTELPLLLVAGAGDRIIPPERTLEQGGGPRAKRVLLDGSGHMSMMESPAELAEAITSFVTGITAQGGSA